MTWITCGVSEDAELESCIHFVLSNYSEALTPKNIPLQVAVTKQTYIEDAQKTVPMKRELARS